MTRSRTPAVSTRAGADGDVTVVLQDDLDLATTSAVRREVEAALRSGSSSVTVDLTDCGFIGVDGVNLLASLSVAARRQGRDLELVGMRPAARRVVSLLDLEDALLTVR